MIQRLARWWAQWWTPRPLTVALFPQLPPHQRECPKCRRVVTHWVTFADNRILCAACDQEPAPVLRPARRR